jgi:hypothetical protein
VARLPAAALAGLIALSPLPADAQRANAFDPARLRDSIRGKIGR